MMFCFLHGYYPGVWEAQKRAGLNGYNWKYGDCYLAHSMFETPSGVEGEEKELSFLMPTRSWHHVPVEVVRYAIRFGEEK